MMEAHKCPRSLSSFDPTLLCEVAKVGNAVCLIHNILTQDSLDDVF